MNKGIIRAFALGILLATACLGTIYYSTPSEPLTKSELDAYLKKNKLVLLSENEYKALQEAAKKKGQINTPQKLKPEPPKTIHIYHLVIKQGDVPEKFAKELEEAHIIADAKGLTDYLEAHGLTRAVRPGTYEIRSDMQYEEIAQILTNTKR
ncbi:endolytic transglycosylase MltG [Anoxybacteroides tepidamans]|uniref:endolytic transglycosylase MltG n=1 Tax=Anoxybacteroides tepidamans TaxID=265948 RepID=UPI0004869796|nr:endolytic transglycosylase MltG [Anoxybacillus tepidamans]